MGYFRTDTRGLRTILVLRDFGLPLLAFALPFFLSLRYFQLLVVVGAQYHFMMAYWYQYRSGKMNHRYLLLAGLCAVVCIGILTQMSNPYLFIFFITSVLFGTHFAYDEVQLHDETWTPENVITVIGFVLLHISIHIGLFWSYGQYLVTGMSILLLSYMAVRVTAQKLPSKAERYLWYLSVLFIGYHATHFDTRFGLGVSLMAIVVMHFFNWMIGYGVRVHKTPRERRYWFETIAFIGFFSLWAIVYALTNSVLLGYVYGTIYYFCWAIAHIVLSAFVTVEARR